MSGERTWFYVLRLMQDTVPESEQPLNGNIFAKIPKLYEQWIDR